MSIQTPVCSVLMVCMGNICRSPLAEGLLQEALQQRGQEALVQLESAGTHSQQYRHVGHPPDARTQANARLHGVDLSQQQSRQLDPSDFELFDLILVMDEANYHEALALAPVGMPHEAAKAKLRWVLDLAPSPLSTRFVPDPYFGGEDGFETVFQLLQTAMVGVLTYLEDHHGLPRCH